MAEDLKLVRTVGIVGQGEVGKTSLADALVFVAGAANRQGVSMMRTPFSISRPRRLSVGSH